MKRLILFMLIIGLCVATIITISTYANHLPYTNSQNATKPSSTALELAATPLAEPKPRSVEQETPSSIATSETTHEEKYKARIVCYFSTWARFRSSPWNYSVENVPVNRCTHIMYAFGGVDARNYRLKDLEQPIGEGWGGDFMRLRQLSPKSKLMLSVGGWNEGGKFSKLVSSAKNRKSFIDSFLETMDEFTGFDGLDLSWQYPGDKTRAGDPSDKENFVLFLRELRAAMDKYVTSKHGRRLELSTLAPPTKYRLDEGYNVAELCQVVDFISLLTYDMRGEWNNFVDVHTPLYRRRQDDASRKDLNTNDSSAHFHSLSCPKNKMVIGLAFYGRTYTLKSADNSSLFAPIDENIRTGIKGEFTQNPGTLSFYEICLKLMEPGWTTKFDNEGKCPYAFKGDQWIGYENVISIAIKIDWIRQEKYGGATIWAMDYDDYLGACGGKHALLEAVAEGFRGAT